MEIQTSKDPRKFTVAMMSAKIESLIDIVSVKFTGINTA